VRAAWTPILRLLLAALLVAAVAPAASAAAVKPAPVLKGIWTRTFPQSFQGNSVAIGPGGRPVFGVSMETQAGPSLAHVTAAGKLALEEVRKSSGSVRTGSVQFDPKGNLWFAIQEFESDGESIGRLAPDGELSEFPLPEGKEVNSLVIGPEGDVWFTRGGYGEKAEAQIGRLTQSGALTEFPLGSGGLPASITVGPDGALWFVEEEAGVIGRITTGGEVRLLPLGPKVEPHQVVSGPDGALWFSENPQPHHYGKSSDRIGRITTEGAVTQFTVPFGEGTWSLAADPRGVVWFTTTKGEFSSISRSGNVGPRGCVRACGDPIEGLALAPNGALWFAAGHEYCERCGGGSDLILNSYGTLVGKLAPGALEPAEPDGPPSIDPYAAGQPKPAPPIARTEKAELVGEGFAELTGFINSRGFPTTWRFKWGRTKAYGHHGFAPEFPFGSGGGSAKISEPIDGLCPGKTYHFEIVAYGPGGRTPGGDETFETPPEKHPPKRCRAH
jgi:virginiamycin B lyase